MAKSKAKENGDAPKSNKLERHPLSLEFSLPMTDEERVGLGKDISKNGQHQEIILYQGQILDGWERYIACLQQGVTPKFKTYEGNCPAAVAFGTNAHRRKMNSAQKALLGARYLIRMQNDGHNITQKEVASAVQVSLQRLNEVVQLLRATDKESQRAVAALSTNPEITWGQLNSILVDCGIAKPDAPPAPAPAPAQARATGPGDDDDDYDPDMPDGDDADIDAALSDVDHDDDDDDDDMPEAKGAINLLNKNGGKRVGHNTRPSETPASRAAEHFKSLTANERVDFVRFCWGTLRPALEQAIDQGRIEWALVAAHAEPGRAATADMAATLLGKGQDLDAALAEAAADGQPAAPASPATPRAAKAAAAAAIDRAKAAAGKAPKAPAKGKGKAPSKA